MRLMLSKMIAGSKLDTNETKSAIDPCLFVLLAWNRQPIDRPTASRPAIAVASKAGQVGRLSCGT